MKPTPTPLYSGENLTPAYHLRYTWTGWPSRNGEPFQSQPPEGIFDPLRSLWESDGLRFLEHDWSPESIQLAFSVKPTVSPVLCAARAKGRLQHQLRQLGQPRKFSRKVALRSVGRNTRETVENYVRDQVTKEGFVEEGFAERLKSLQHEDSTAKLSEPATTASGRYWYNLHLVLVTAERYRVADGSTLQKLSDGCLKIAKKKGYAISQLSVMPDHLHIALRGNVEESPHGIALAFQNNLAYLIGQQRIWMDGYYVGTFGEYDMKPIRARAGGGE